MNVQHPQHPFPRKFTSFTTFSPGSLHEKIALTVSCFYFAWLSLQSGSRVHVLLYRVLRSVDNNVSFQDLPVRNPVILLQKNGAINCCYRSLYLLVFILRQHPSNKTMVNFFCSAPVELCLMSTSVAVVEEPRTKGFAAALALTCAFTPGFLSQLQAVQKKVSLVPICTSRKTLP